MAVEQLKIKQFRGKQVIVKVAKQSDTKEVKGLVTKRGNIAFPVGEIMAVGHKCSDDIKVGQKIICFGQSLGYSIDTDELSYLSEDKDYNYFIIFEDQIDAILEDERTQV